MHGTIQKKKRDGRKMDEKQVGNNYDLKLDKNKLTICGQVNMSLKWMETNLQSTFKE